MLSCAVTSDLDIYRSANVLIEHYGADAELEAVQRAEQCASAGDVDGWAVWERILKAVGVLWADCGGSVRIPRDCDHRFHGNATTHSIRSRPLVPHERDHRSTGLRPLCRPV